MNKVSSFDRRRGVSFCFAGIIGSMVLGCSEADPAEPEPAYSGEAYLSQVGGTVYGGAGYTRVTTGCKERLATPECAIRECVTEPVPWTLFDAGDITAAGVELNQATTGAYLSILTVPFPYEQPITFDVSGSREVPSHELGVTAPSLVSLTEPAAGAAVVINRAADFAVRVSPGRVGTIQVRLSVEEPASSVTIECAAAVSGGAVVLPQSALSALPLPTIVGVVTLETRILTRAVKLQSPWELFAFAEYELLNTRPQLL
jgi:hypothetical protein